MMQMVGKGWKRCRRCGCVVIEAAESSPRNTYHLDHDCSEHTHWTHELGTTAWLRMNKLVMAIKNKQRLKRITWQQKQVPREDDCQTNTTPVKQKKIRGEFITPFKEIRNTPRHVVISKRIVKSTRGIGSK